MTSQQRASALFVLILALMLVALNVAFCTFLFVPLNASTLAYLWIVEFYTFGVAYEIAELSLAYWFSPPVLPRRVGALLSPRVAALCTTCDDLDPQTVRLLAEQKYGNLTVVVLDDSSSASARAAVDSLGTQVVRRPTRAGYKAGNLNNWLSQYGRAFDYFVVADADSHLPSTFVADMVAYANHPANADIAVFESLIRPWNTRSRFAQLQGLLAPVRHRVSLAFANQAHATMSVGHNNLYRTSAILAVGGFSEHYLAEDFATTIALVRDGWRCMTVPVESFERAPTNVAEYAKREARWAYQTFQLLNVRTDGLSVAAKLKLLSALHHYLKPLVLLAGLLLCIIFGGLTLNTLATLPAAVVPARGTRLLWFWAILLALLAFPHTLAGMYEGVPLVPQLRGSLFYISVAVGSAWAVTWRLIGSLLGDRLGFNRTGYVSQPDIWGIVRLGWPTFLLAWLALAIVLTTPGMGGLNLLWLLPAAFSPLVLHYYQRELNI